MNCVEISSFENSKVFTSLNSFVLSPNFLFYSCKKNNFSKVDNVLTGLIDNLIITIQSSLKSLNGCWGEGEYLKKKKKKD